MYSKLYAKFGRDPFTLAEACAELKFNIAKLNVAFSELHDSGALIVFERGRPRHYRLLDPRSLILRMSGKVERVKFVQEQYLQLIFDVLTSLRKSVRLTSFCVYGSVSRGQAKKSSDLDILLVSDDFTGTVASRLDLLSFVDGEVKDEIRFLRKSGYTTAVSFMPLRRDEAGQSPILFLDIAVNSTILYDEHGFLAGILSRLRAKLELTGAKRIERENGWLWDLKPDYRQGDVIVI